MVAGHDGWTDAGRRGSPMAAIAIGCLAILAASPAPADPAFPTRPVRIVVPYSAGGTADLVPRIIAERLSRKWGQPVTIENRTGGGGNIGAEYVARSDPDGHTLLATPPGPLVVNQNLYGKLGFDPAEFAPVTIMARVPNALVANPSRIAATTVADFVAKARADPGRITCATQGNGTTSHLTCELFQLMTGAKLVVVPYRGSAPALQGLIAGDVDVMFDNLGVSLPLVKGGALRLLGVATEARLSALPDVPSIAETLAGFSSSTWFAIVAPPRTPQAIVAILNRDVVEALHAPDVGLRLADLSAEPVGDTPQSAAAYLRDEAERWHKVIKAAGIKVE